jgi:hypothetical protein
MAMKAILLMPLLLAPAVSAATVSPAVLASDLQAAVTTPAAKAQPAHRRQLFEVTFVLLPAPRESAHLPVIELGDGKAGMGPAAGFAGYSRILGGVYVNPNAYTCYGRACEEERH